MDTLRRRSCLFVVLIALSFNSRLSLALEFHSGVGVDARYTDNAKLKPDNQASDIITRGRVRASLAEVDGPLIYDVAASARKEKYINDTFEDKTYYNLGLKSNWEMVRERFDWYLTDYYTQRLIDALDPSTPDNLQDTNAFTFGANINFPISGRQKFKVIPQFSQYYYSKNITDNKQYSLAAIWDYQLFRLTNVGLSINGRNIQYDDKSIADTTFSVVSFVVSGRRVHSTYSLNIGATTVKRESAETPGGTTSSSDDTGFTGKADWQLDLSSRSFIEVLALTELSDTSRVSQVDAPGNPNDVQLTTDVIRNSIARLTYTREDASLHTEIHGSYRKIRHADNTDLNSLIQLLGAKLTFPVTQLVSSGVFLNFNKINREEISRVDKRFDFGVDLNVIFTATLTGSIDVQYRTKESTDSLQNYDEFSLAARLDYNF